MYIYASLCACLVYDDDDGDMPFIPVQHDCPHENLALLTSTWGRIRAAQLRITSLSSTFPHLPMAWQVFHDDQKCGMMQMETCNEPLRNTDGHVHPVKENHNQP